MISTNYVRRNDYATAAPQDRFIVSLLRYHIHNVLSNYGKPIKANSCALDVGCGSQPFRQDLEALSYSYISLDAEQNSEKTVNIVCPIDQPLPPEALTEGEFDFILCTEVMEHVANWQGAFENFSKLLAPGGRLLITCPFIYPLHEEPYDYWRPTPYTFQYFAEKYHLEIIHQVRAGDGWDVLGTLLANFEAKPKSRSFKSRLLYKIFYKCHKALLKSLLNGDLQKTLNAEGTLYQANIVVFQK